MERLIAKITNLFKEKNEEVNQFIYAEEDTLNLFYKIKGANTKIISNNVLKIDSYGMP